MQYVPGKTLEELWPSMDEAAKTAVAQKLRGSFGELRRLKWQEA
jgi:hypothetical protein